MIGAPEDPVHRGGVPEADGDEGGVEGEINVARPAEHGHVNIGLAPAGQCHVPAFPEFGDVGREERPVEILHDPQAKEEAGADRDVGVAGEIEVNVEIRRYGQQPELANMDGMHRG